jgi:hypothetical protein
MDVAAVGQAMASRPIGTGPVVGWLLGHPEIGLELGALIELIWIGDDTLIGAFTRITVHAYDGAGRFRYGLVDIGKNCLIGGGTGMGPIKIEDGVRTLPGTTLSPYLVRVRAGSVVGYNPPAVRLPGPAETAQAEAGNPDIQE